MGGNELQGPPQLRSCLLPPTAFLAWGWQDPPFPAQSGKAFPPDALEKDAFLSERQKAPGF